ncbi:transposase [Rhizobium laguerreae]|uniref:Transposase n=1 Tax=Rhizobium laguerreae TaxID=1076926 RepID=A0ABR6GK72_9HYPH|nr:transposase [Rhizobium laguerreae]
MAWIRQSTSFNCISVNAAERPILRKKMRRKEMVDFFAICPPTVIAIEACAASHHWARLLTGFGHEVKLIVPQLAKPYVKRGKNDAADAEALCEAMSRPTMRFVPVKSAAQQAALMLVGMRERAVAAQTQLANTIRGYAAEFGLTAAKGMSHLPLLLETHHAVAQRGRSSVWNPRRGTHLGQRSCVNATKGRTKERKRSDQIIKEFLQGGGRPHMAFSMKPLFQSAARSIGCGAQLIRTVSSWRFSCKAAEMQRPPSA